MSLPRVLLRVLLVLLVCLLPLRATGTEQGTVPVLLVGLLPVVLLPAYPALVVGLVARDRLVAGLALLLVAAHVLVLAPALGARSVSAAAAAAPRLRVAVANLYVLNRDPVATGRALRALDLDVLVVPELDPAGLAGLRASGLLDDLPHAVVDGQASQETVGLLSRRPLRDVRLQRGSGRVLPRAGVQVGGQVVRLLAVHALPPVGPLQAPWRRLLRDLETEVRQPDPVVLLGDLNADRDHGPFRRLLATGLRDAADERGRGLARTWPAGAPLLHLDHVLVRDGDAARLEVLDLREVVLPGTDHLAVVADLALVPARSAS